MTKTIDIYNSRNDGVEDFAGEAWAPEFFREMDLVVAANVFRNRLDRDFFAGYDPVGLRVAERCLPLDGGAESRFMGVVALSMYTRHDDPAWQEAARALAAMPRGHWQIWSDGQGFDLFAASGTGRICTPSGNKFLTRRSRAPGLDLLNAYAAVISKMVYETHCRIGREILARTVRDVDLKVGRTWKDKRIDGREWKNVKFTGVDEERFPGERGWRFEVSRQGSRKAYVLREDSVRQLLELPWIMPEQYVVDDGVDRTSTLYERRTIAANAAFDVACGSFGFDSHHGSRAGFINEGNRLERDVYEIDVVRGSFVVDFEPGTDVIASSEYLPGRNVARIAMAA